MKRSIFTLIGIFLSVMVFSQTIVFQENFEGSTIGFTSSSVKNNNNWATSSQLASQGTKSDSATVGLADTTYLTSNTFSCTNMSFVQLEFDQIAKIEFFDMAIIEVSADNGNTWTQLTGSQYLGSGQFGNIGNKFNSTSYVDWLPASSNAVPTNSWWKHETFNISSLVADSSQVKIRFTLIDVNSTGAAGNYGWLIDSVKVTASFSELIPPVIAIIPPYPHDTAYTSGPFDVIANITDNTGLDTCQVIYSTTTGVVDTLGMNMISQDTFKASIPFYGYGRSITYYIKAIDSSPAHNVDSVGPYTFFCKYSPGGTFTVGNLSTTSSTTYSNPFGQLWTGNREQFLILASELQALNAGGGNITSVAFNVSSTNNATSSGSNHDGFTIKMKNTTSSSMSSTFETGLTQVYTTTSYQTVQGWNTFTFTTPFTWDGVSNIIVETCFDNGASNWSNNAGIYSNTTTFNSCTYSYSDASYNECTKATGTAQTHRPDMQFVMQTPSNLTHDIGVYQITNPTGGVVAGQAFSIKVRVKNFGVDTITSGTINWKFDGVAQTPYTISDTILPDSLTPEITLGTKTLSGAGSHYLLTWTDNPNGISDFNVANDSASLNFYACSALLNGTYTIGGTNPDYATFGDAVLALNQCGISGPVTFNVAAGTYNEHFELLPVNGSSATNTVTFKAANGDSSSVILNYNAAGTVDNYVIKLNGASYIHIKNMTIQAADSNYCNAIVLGDVCHDVSITNNVIKTAVPQFTDNTDAVLINTADSVGANITINQNAFYQGSRAVSLFSNVNRSGWQVSNNTFNATYSRGIRIIKSHDAQVSGNILSMDSLTSEYQAITLSDCNGTPTIYDNNIKAPQSQIGYGIILASSVFDSTNHAQVYNNMVLLNGNSSGNTLSCGILVNNAANIDLYYNTVHMKGNQTLAASLCMFDQGSTPNTDFVNIKNNIFTNNAGGYLVYIQSVDSSEYTNDYNMFYNWGNGKFAYRSGLQINDFAAWLTQTGEGTHSDTIDPYYASGTDLHVANNLINGRALPIAGITTDIDGDTRNTTTPDPGADEFTPSPYDATTLAILAPGDACGLDTNETVIVRYKNIGSATISGNFTGSYQIMGGSNVVTENITATILPGDTLDYSFSTKANLDVSSFGYDSTFTIKAWCTLTGDNIHQNDTAQGDVNSGYVPGLLTVADDTIQYGDVDTLIATGGNNVYWWLTDTSTTELVNDSVFVTPNLYDTTTYWVSDRAGSGLQTLQIGTGTNTNTQYSYPTPFGQFYTGCREQYLILASELQAIGASPGPIESIAFDVVTTNGPTSQGSNHQNYTIKLKNTSVSSLTNTFETGLTQVYTVASYQTVSGWNTFNFSTPFVWDGTSNLLVEVCFDNGASNYSNNAVVNRTNTSFTSVIDRHSDASSNTCQDATGTTYSQRPNMKLSIHGQGCFGDRSPVTVYVTGFPQYDAGLDSNLLSPVGSVPSGTQALVKGVLHNYGQVTMTSVQIPWKLNGVPQDTLFWTGNLPYGAVDTVTIDTISLTGGIYTVQAYTRLPNNVVDTFNTNDTAYSTFNSCLNGTYTIGDTINGSADFGSFNGAIAALVNAGICGNVTFLVDSGSYTEQVIIPEITGMDANNTVTFQGATGDSTDVILKYSASSYSSDYTLKLDGGDYFTFKNMTIKGESSSYPGVVEIGNNSEHNTFMNNVIDMPSVTTSYARGFYSSGSNDNYNTIENNFIKNGYYGIYMRGVSSSSKEKGLVVKNNIIDGFYYYGMYLQYHDSVQIDHNYLADGSNSNYGYAMYLYYCDGATHIVNNVFNLQPGSYKYGIRLYYCDGTATERGLIANNMISITSGSSNNFGLYFYNSTKFDIYYNSINITSGSSNSRAAYFAVYSSAADVNVENNIFRDSIGYTVYMSNSSGISAFDYNSYYSAAYNFAYWNGNRSDLTALQAASGKDSNSVTVDPQFFSSTDLHMFTTQLSGLGHPNTVVTTDIDGELRSPILPTIGADEVPLLPYDIGVINILQVSDTTNENQSITPKAVVKNFGTDTVVGYAVQYTVNNGTPVLQNVTDTLFVGTTDTITLASFNSPAGNSHICAKTILAADSNFFNDEYCKNFFGIPTKDAFVTRIEEIPGGCGLTTDTVRIWVKNVGIDTINGSGQTTPTVSYKSNTAATVTENFTNVVAPGDSVQHVFQTAVSLAAGTVSDSTFNIVAWIDWTGDNVSYNDTAYTSVFSAHVPAAPTVTSPVNVPYGSPATLTATSTDSVLWYQTDTSSNYFHMGSSYTTGFNYNDDTLWVAAMNGTADLKLTETVQFKNGSGHTNPYPSYFPTSDFDGFEITNLGSAPQDLGGWSVHVRGAQTINYTFPSGTVLNAGQVLTCVYGFGATSSPANMMFAIATSTSISSSSLVGYYIKDSQGNVVDAFASNGYTFQSSTGVTAADWSGSITGLGGQAGAIRLISDNNNASDWGGASSNTASFGTFNPQLQGATGAGNGCTSVRVPIAIHVTGQLAADLGATKLLAPVSAIGLGSTEQVQIRVRNFGTAAQSNIPVGYTVNNGAVKWDTITSTINAGDSLDYTFGPTADLSIQGQSYAIKAFTALTNPLDSNALNDTVSGGVTNMLPNYCTCASTSTGYEDLTGIAIGTWSYSNPATGANYTDYTSVTPTAVIAPGQSYNISVSSGFPPGYSYAYTCHTNVFIDYNRDGDFTDPGELVYSAQTNSNNTVSGTMTVPVTNVVYGTTRMRVVLRESGTQSNTGPCGTFSWGECEDYNIMIMTPIAQDAGAEIVLQPNMLNTAHVVPLVVQVRNYGTQMFDTVPVSYVLNGAAPVTVYHADTVQPLDSTIVNFGNITLQDGANSICVYTALPGDSNAFNDQICTNPYVETTVNLSYFDNFEGNNIWRKANGQWEHGVPQMSSINSAHSPVNVWGIDLDSTYANNSSDTLYSPKIVIPTYADSALLSFWNNYVTQSGQDGGFIQYYISGGTGFWANLGYTGDLYGVNWLNTNVGGTYMWTGNSNGWIESKYRMVFTNIANPFNNAQGDTVQFRFIFHSNNYSNNYDGWAIDDFKIQLPPIPQDGGVIAITSPDTSSQIGSSVTVTVTVKNFGTQNLTSIPVKYDINGSGNWVSETFTPSSPLMPDSVASYSFTTTFTAPNAAYQICAKTAVSGDVYTQNDETCKSVNVTIAPVDGGVSQVMVAPVVPGNGVDTTKASWTVVPSIYIKNYGSNSLSNFTVEYRIGSGNWRTETYSGAAIPAGDSALYQFTNGFSSPLGPYTLTARTQITNDADPTNDDVSKSLFGIIDVGMADQAHDAFYVKQNEPNPARGVVRIDYYIPNGGVVKFELKNALGQDVINTQNDEIAGLHTFKVDADKLPSGVYYYTIEYDGVRKTMKMVVNR